MTDFASRRDRVFATLAGDPVDRPPMSFWGHIYDREGSAADLAAQTLERRERHDWDFVKLNPRASYHGEPWGLGYSTPRHALDKPTRQSFPLRTSRDFRSMKPVPGDALTGFSLAPLNSVE